MDGLINMNEEQIRSLEAIMSIAIIGRDTSKTNVDKSFYRNILYLAENIEIENKKNKS